MAGYLKPRSPLSLCHSVAVLWRLEASDQISLEVKGEKKQNSHLAVSQNRGKPEQLRSCVHSERYRQPRAHVELDVAFANPLKRNIRQAVCCHSRLCIRFENLAPASIR